MPARQFGLSKSQGLLLSFLNRFAKGICFLLRSGLNFICNKSDVVRQILSYLKLILNLYLNVGLCIHTVVKTWEISLNETTQTSAL